MSCWKCFFLLRGFWNSNNCWSAADGFSSARLSGQSAIYLEFSDRWPISAWWDWRLWTNELFMGPTSDMVCELLDIERMDWLIGGSPLTGTTWRQYSSHEGILPSSLGSFSLFCRSGSSRGRYGNRGLEPPPLTNQSPRPGWEKRASIPPDFS